MGVINEKCSLSGLLLESASKFWIISAIANAGFIPFSGSAAWAFLPEILIIILFTAAVNELFFRMAFVDFDGEKVMEVPE